MKKLQFTFGKSKGQASGEYVVIIAVAVVFVLAIIVTAGAFLQDPAKKATVEQGGLIQRQLGDLQKGLDKTKVTYANSPQLYGGFVESPAVVSFEVGVCLKSAALYSNESGVFKEVSVLNDLQGVEVGKKITFPQRLNGLGEVHYNVLACTCEDVCSWALDGNTVDGRAGTVMAVDFAERPGDVESGINTSAFAFIVPVGDPRFLAAKRGDDGEDRPRAAPIRNLATKVISLVWHCEGEFPIASISVNADGENLVNLSAICRAERQALPVSTKRIGWPDVYSILVPGQEVGYSVQTACTSRICNSTNCVEAGVWLQKDTCQQQREEPQAPREPQLPFSVVLNQVNRDPNVAMPGFADAVLTFTINANDDGQFQTNAFYNDERGQRQRTNIGQYSRGENYFTAPVWQFGHSEVYIVEICRNNQCVNSNNGR